MIGTFGALSVHRYFVAYRFPDGDVQGFFGTSGRNPSDARRDAIRRIQRLLAPGEIFNCEAFYECPKKAAEQLTPHEIFKVQHDWATQASNASGTTAPADNGRANCSPPSARPARGGFVRYAAGVLAGLRRKKTA